MRKVLQHRISHRDRQNNRLRVVPKPEGEIIMKKKTFKLPCIIMATMLSATLPISASETSTTVPSSEEAETENYTPVTSGDIWDIAQS